MSFRLNHCNAEETTSQEAAKTKAGESSLLLTNLICVLGADDLVQFNTESVNIEKLTCLKTNLSYSLFFLLKKKKSKFKSRSQTGIKIQVKNEANATFCWHYDFIDMVYSAHSCCLFSSLSPIKVID